MPSTYPDVGVLATVVLLGVFQQKNLHYGLAVLTGCCDRAGRGDLNSISKALPEQGQRPGGRAWGAGNQRQLGWPLPPLQ